MILKRNRNNLAIPQKILYNKDAFLYVAHLHMLDRVLDGSSIDSINVELNEEIVICLAGEDW